MFAYCRNGPTYRIDESGYGDIDLEESLDDDTDVGPNDDEMGPGPTPPQINTGNVTTSNGSGGGAGSTGSPTSSNSNGNPTYPQNPNDFNPQGLVLKKHVEIGSGGNGGIYKWYYPGNKNPIFEWDEDYKVGSHYHAMMVEWGGVHSGDHLWPGMLIEEPWRSEFF